MSKWITIKILEELRNEIKPFVDNGKFSNTSDFVTYAIRKELDRLQ